MRERRDWTSTHVAFTDVLVRVVLEEIYILQGFEEIVRAAFNFSFFKFFLTEAYLIYNAVFDSDSILHVYNSFQ